MSQAGRTAAGGMGPFLWDGGWPGMPESGYFGTRVHTAIAGCRTPSTCEEPQAVNAFSVLLTVLPHSTAATRFVFTFILTSLPLSVRLRCEVQSALDFT